MATYKVIQDIEAEDKFLGPLTLKQFVFGATGLFFGYLNIFSVTRGLPWLLVIFSPPMLLGIFLAVPWSKDQSTEVWVLAKLRFYFKPRRRIWDQSGMEELVTITAPKKEEKQVVDNLSKTEVKSRLKILAETIDSRGWAIKDAKMQNVITPMESNDRLVSASTLPHEVPIVDLATIPDVYDESSISNENFDRMIRQSADMHKAQSLEVMEQVRQGGSATNPTQFTAPVNNFQQTLPPEPVMTKAEEQALTKQLKDKHQQNFATARMHKINPINQTNADDPIANFMQTYDDPMVAQQSTKANDLQDTTTNDQTTVPAPSSPAILELAGNNDLDVATIARQAKKESEDDGEVVISLR